MPRQSVHVREARQNKTATQPEVKSESSLFKCTYFANDDGPNLITEENISDLSGHNVQSQHPSPPEGQGINLNKKQTTDGNELDRELDDLLTMQGEERRTKYFKIAAKFPSRDMVDLSSAITKRGWAKRSALPEDIAQVGRAADAARQRKYTASLSEEAAAERRAIRAKQRRASRAATKAPRP